MALTKIAPNIIAVANNVTNKTVGNTTSIASVTFDGAGVVTSASNVAISGAGITANTIANSAFQTGSIENYSRAANLFGMRNRLINGSMVIWQRGTSFTNQSNGGTASWSADRWSGWRGGFAANQDVSRQAGFSGFQYCLRLQRTSGTTSTQGITAAQVIESVNCLDLAGQSVTISAIIRAGANYSGTNISMSLWTGTGTDQGVGSLMNGTWTTQASQFVAKTITTTETLYTATFTVPSGTTELAVSIGYAPTGTAGANDYIEITGVQLEAGSTATNFEYRHYTNELQLCQRYYQQWGGNSGNERLGVGYSHLTTQARVDMPLVVTMRSSPTVTYSAVGDWAVEAAAGTVTVTAIAVDQPSPRLASLLFTVASGLTAGQGLHIMANGTTNARFNLSAEL